jgi:acyl-CoA reductase-like NAD-dependent aldehyde dehydrogenase
MAIITPVETTPGARRRVQITNPATLEPIGEIELQTAEDVGAAIATARNAQPAWAALSFRERGQYMIRALQILLERQDEFINIILSETPKPRLEALQMDIYSVCDTLHYYAKMTAKLLRSEKKRVHGLLGFMKTVRIVYPPLGIVGIITPWNAPFNLSINPTVQALMAGNAVLLKPSSATPLSGKLVGDLLHAAGLPEGVLTVLLGDSETGEALINGEVDKISFTGSVATGRTVAASCCHRLIPCTLELGGKDPMIVCGDADVDKAAGGAIAGAFMNAGQICLGTERIYAIDTIADEFISKVVERVSKLRQQTDGEFDIGAIITPQQLEIIEKHVADAIAKGAKVLIGGRRNPNLKGLYYEPTVLTDVTHDMLVMTEETFGPILPIMRVRDEDEAIRMANDTDYGLSANVWTRDKRKGFMLAQRIHAGSVCMNDIDVTYGVLEAPFGGRKSSGLGQVNGDIGLRGYCYTQPIVIDRFNNIQTTNRYPYSAKMDSLFQKFIRFMWGTRLGRRLSIIRLPL